MVMNYHEPSEYCDGCGVLWQGGASIGGTRFVVESGVVHQIAPSLVHIKGNCHLYHIFAPSCLLSTLGLCVL